MVKLTLYIALQRRWWLIFSQSQQPRLNWTFLKNSSLDVSYKVAYPVIITFTVQLALDDKNKWGC